MDVRNYDRWFKPTYLKGQDGLLLVINSIFKFIKFLGNVWMQGEAAWLNFFYRITEVLGYNWCNENLSRFTNKGNLPFWVIIFHESLFFLHLEVYTKFCPTLFLTCIFVIKLIAEEPVPIKPYSLIQLSLKTIFMCCRFIKYSATVVSMKFILLDQCSL